VTSVTTILQTEVPPGLRGQAQSTVATLVSAANLVSMSLAGLAAGAAGVRPASSRPGSSWSRRASRPAQPSAALTGTVAPRSWARPRWTFCFERLGRMTSTTIK
jgi:hypothetical protein